MQQALWRYGWLALLMAQLALYYFSYPHLAAIVGPQRLPGGTLGNVLALDVLGGMSWCGVLVFAEEKLLQAVTWLKWTLVGLFAFTALGVAYLNIHAWL